MRSQRQGTRRQVIDHLICCALIEGRSCEKFQILAGALRVTDPELAGFYGSLVESENGPRPYFTMELIEGGCRTTRGTLGVRWRGGWTWCCRQRRPWRPRTDWR
jgi:hypothetical protein